MTLQGIPFYRLLDQKILNSDFTDPKDIVKWMGAMQAQDFNWVKWAIGIRLQNSTEGMINNSINKGEIFRTHLLRPTWHIVSADDIKWMLELTAPQIKAKLKTRHKQLEITESLIKKCRKILINSLSGGNHLTRDKLIKRLEKERIITSDNRASHLFLLAELDGILCSGSVKNGKQTYALFSERVTNQKNMDKEKALAGLAERYFQSHSPATLKDFSWWSGLSATDSKEAIEMVKTDLIREKINGEFYLFSDSLLDKNNGKKNIFFLPAYDEFIISYKDRSASLIDENHSKAVSSNGIFRPIIVIDGKAAGTWKKTIKKDKVFIEAEFFDKNSGKKIIKDVLKKSIHYYENFLGMGSELILK